MIAFTNGRKWAFSKGMATGGEEKQEKVTITRDTGMIHLSDGKQRTICAQVLVFG